MVRTRIKLVGVASPVAISAYILLTLSTCSCAAPWTVRFPAALPAGAVVACNVPSRCDSLCGFLPDGRVVAWTFGRKLILCDPNTGRRTAELDVKAMTTPGPFHAGTGRLVILGPQSAELWDLAGAEPRRVMRTEGKYPGRTAFSPDGSLLAIGDYALGLYDAGTGKLLREIKPAPDPNTGHDRSLHDLTFSSDGRIVAAVLGGQAPEVALWTIANGRLLHCFSPIATAQAQSVNILGLSRDGHAVLLREAHHVPMPPGVYDGPVRMSFSAMLHDAATGKRLLTLSSAAIIADGGRFVIDRPEGKAEIDVYDAATGKKLRTLDKAVNVPAAAGKWLVAAAPAPPSRANIRSFTFWDIETGKAVASVTVQGWYSEAKAVSPDGRLAVLDSGGRICVVSRDTGRKLIELDPKRHLDAVWHFVTPTFSPDSRRLAFLHDGVLGVVNLAKFDR